MAAPPLHIQVLRVLADTAREERRQTTSVCSSLVLRLVFFPTSCRINSAGFGGPGMGGGANKVRRDNAIIGKSVRITQGPLKVFLTFSLILFR